MRFDNLRNFLFFLAACAKDGNDNSTSDREPTKKPKAEGMSGKSTQDVLNIKYDKAVFYCDLWVQRGTFLIKSNAPSDQFSWNLLNDFGVKKTFNLQGQVQDHSFSTTVSVESLEIFGLVHFTTADGAVYKMGHTPVIGMNVAMIGAINHPFCN